MTRFVKLTSMRRVRPNQEPCKRAYSLFAYTEVKKSQDRGYALKNVRIPLKNSF